MMKKSEITIFTSLSSVVTSQSIALNKAGLIKARNMRFLLSFSLKFRREINRAPAISRNKGIVYKLFQEKNIYIIKFFSSSRNDFSQPMCINNYDILLLYLRLNFSQIRGQLKVVFVLEFFISFLF